MGNRGILSSLGAGLSLVVAGVLLLAVVTGIVAFRGWPELREDAATGRVPLAVLPERVSDDEAVVLGAAETGGAPAPALASVPATRRARLRRPRVRETGRVGAAPRSPSASPGAPAPTPAPGAAPAAEPAAPLPAARRAPAPVTRAVEGAGRVVETVVERPGDVPAIVEETTRTVRDVVDDTGAAGSGLLP